MSGRRSIRLATAADGAAVAAIYAPFCELTAVSFEYAAPSAGEMASRIVASSAQYPWLVMTDGDRLAGYAYASRHRDRAAYAWSVDTAVYVGPDDRRQGVGGALYRRLFELLRVQGYVNAFAGITVPNPASVALHQSAGFTPVGVYHGVGYKLKAWHDVAWFRAELQPPPVDPPAPRPIASLAVPDVIVS